MKNERWEGIEQVFHAARERKGEERARYLDEVCGPDVGLRRKVELLLQEDDKTERLLNTPVELIVATLSPSTAVGRYEVVGVAGRGGMGQVYRARDRRLKREVALKALPGVVAHDKPLLARFQREATVLASLNHPNIATIYDVVERDGAPFLVLEFIDGATLAERLLRGALPVDEILRIASQIAMGLQAAHEKGIVHLDLKPGNIMI